MTTNIKSTLAESTDTQEPSIDVRLKKYFEPGDVPTSDEFGELIDAVTSADALITGTLDNARFPTQIDLSKSGTVSGSYIKAGSFDGKGANLTNLNASNISSGTLAIDRLPVKIDLSRADTVTDSHIKAGSFEGNGEKLTDLNAKNIRSGTLANDRLPVKIDLSRADTVTDSHIKAGSFEGNGEKLTDLNAKNIRSGTLANDRLPGHIDLTQLTDGANTTVKAGSFEGNGAELTNLDASHISQGTLNPERLPAQIDLTTLTQNSDSKVVADMFEGNGAGLQQLDPKALSDLVPVDKLPVTDIENELSFLTTQKKIKTANLPVASQSQKGILKLATADEAADTTRNDVALSPATLASALSLENLFEFVEDTGQTITADDIPDGKILALYITVS